MNNHYKNSTKFPRLFPTQISTQIPTLIPTLNSYSLSYANSYAAHFLPGMVCRLELELYRKHTQTRSNYRSES